MVVWNQFVLGDGQSDQLRLSLQEAAAALIESGHAQPGQCPLCAQPLDLSALAQSITAEVAALDGAARALEAAQHAAKRVVNVLRDAHQKRLDVAHLARGHGVALAELPASPIDDLSRRIDAIAAVDQAAAERYQGDLGIWDANALQALEAATPAPATARDQALVEIGVIHTGASDWQKAERHDYEATAAFNLANRVFMGYQQRQNEHFGRVISRISNRAAEIYQFLHPEGGVTEIMVEVVGEKGAELSVEFHGRKQAPPHRVLSESHLNSLGVALFLAMAETFNEQIGFIVLDDVVNSFDREHRGRLAELLVREFEGTQLIVLTHDEQFYTQLCRRAPAWFQVRFTSWSFEGGPRTKRYEGDRLLTEAREAFTLGDRITAAQKGRRALEEFLQEACEGVEALLPFRRGLRNDQRMADEVMKGLRRTLRERSKLLYEKMSDLLTGLEADLQAVLNIEAHAGRGGTSNQEVDDALTRIAELRHHFTCNDCGTPVWYEGAPDASRCKCGHAQFPPPAA